MTQPSTVFRKDYSGNGATTEFAYTWKIYDKSHLTVTRITVADNTEEVLTVDVDYTVTGVGNTNGGNVVISPAPTSAYDFVITPNFPQEQDIDFTNQAAVPPERVEEGMDKIVGQIKQQQNDISLSLKGAKALGTSYVFRITEAPVDSNVLVWSGTGGDIINATLSSISSEIDTVITGPTANDILVWNGSAWTDKSPSEYAALSGFVTAGDNITFTGTITFSGPVKFADDGELTIASGAITITGSNHTIDTEGDASSDDLDTITGGTDGMILTIRIENDAREVVLKDGTGNIETPDSADITLSDDENAATLIYDAALSKWLVTSTFRADPTIASQAQAEAGTDNTTFMTPLRTAQAIAALGNAIDTQSFDESTGSGTWTKPASGTYAFVRCGGGGGAGCFGTGEGGGGGGACVEGWFLLSDLGATETVTIGAGGSGANSAGGNTTFGSWVTAYGGEHGGNNADDGGCGGGVLGVGVLTGNGGPPDGGAHGSASAGGDSSFGGGGGGDGAFDGGASAWGGGGGGGKDAGNGGASVYGGGGGGADAGTGGTSVFGGNGGDGNASGAGDNGSHGYNGYAGGGGGGSGDGSGGGDGGDGSVLVIVY